MQKRLNDFTTFPSPSSSDLFLVYHNGSTGNIAMSSIVAFVNNSFSAGINSTNSSVSTLSSSINNSNSTISGLSSLVGNLSTQSVKWNSTSTSLSTLIDDISIRSIKWDSTHSILASLSGQLDSSTISRDVTARWQSSYSLVQTLSSEWSTKFSTAFINASANEDIRAIDLTKSVNKLYPKTSNGGGIYTLETGVEGQVLHLVPYTRSDATDTLRVSASKIRYRGDDGLFAEENNIRKYWIPFASGTSVVTLIFTDNYWNLPSNTFTY
jgi:hypothetical protein